MTAPMTNVAYGRVFEPPRPGAWEIDLTHFPRPATRYGSEFFIKSFMPGFAESTKLYGLLLQGLDYIDVHGFMYSTRRAVGAPESSSKPPSKAIFSLLTKFHPEIRRRLRRSKDVVANRAWIDDLRYWDEEVKPAAIREHLAIQRVSLDALDNAALAQHIAKATVNANNAVYRHGRFSLTAYLPVGDYLAHAIEWTGEPLHVLLEPVKGFSDISNGIAATELAALTAELRAAPAVWQTLQQCPPAEAIARLRTEPGRLGDAARAWVEAVGYHIVTGYDLCDYTALEMPEMLIGSIKATLKSSPQSSASPDGEATLARLRDKVPDVRRVLFVRLLADARETYRLREERDHFNDGWSTGLLRHALLHAGRRLADAGRIDDPEFLLDAGHAEVQDILVRGGGPSNDDLRERTQWRRTTVATNVPQRLGFAKPPALPKEWLPEHQARLVRALEVFLSGLFAPTADTSTQEAIRGIPVSPGVYEGVARVVLTPDQFSNVKQGDVLVARSTSPYFNVLLPMLGAIVTDHGGALSHAAIVSREYGIPGVVGTKTATKTIKDGARVRVDGNAGDVRVTG
ncbi:MAG: PEP-utilizing enzyme [Pseudorhodoplanes sp.]